MANDKLKVRLLKSLPGVDRLLENIKTDTWFQDIPRSVKVAAAREAVERLRADILGADPEMDASVSLEEKALKGVRKLAAESMTPNLCRLINATGVIIHTNLGRSLLAASALENIGMVAAGYSNLEFDLATGKRGSRYSIVEDLICEISHAEAAMVVNNNAGAVLLCLETMAKDRNVIVSRGELVEIGGSFRIPDVMARSGALLREVGATNRTHVKDYEQAIDDETGLLLKVHTSNFSVVGFTKSLSLTELVALGKKYDLPVMEDLGSGTLIDFSKYGLLKEPSVQESVAAGVDVVTFSGDKLLGGPQAGIIVGSKEILDRIKKNPITRALRIDKLTLAALESTLRLYRDEKRAIAEIPTLKMLLTPLERLEEKAQKLKERLHRLDRSRLRIETMTDTSRAGGGSMPLTDLPTTCLLVGIEGLSANELERRLRAGRPPLIGRIENECFVMDVRTIGEHEFDVVVKSFDTILEQIEKVKI